MYLINVSQIDKQRIALVNSKIVLEFSVSNPHCGVREKNLNRNLVGKLLEMDKDLSRCTSGISFSKREAL